MTLEIEFEKPLVHLIEPSAAGAAALERALGHAGFRSRCWPDAEDFLGSREEPGHAIVSEMRLPGCGGLELLRRVKTFDGTTPFLFLSDLVDVSVVVSAMKLGAFDFLRKPASVRQLLAAVEAAVHPGREASSQDLVVLADADRTGPVACAAVEGTVPWPVANVLAFDDAGEVEPTRNAATRGPVRTLRRDRDTDRPPLDLPFVHRPPVPDLRERIRCAEQEATFLSSLDEKTRAAVTRLRRLDPDAPLEASLETVLRENAAVPTGASRAAQSRPAWRRAWVQPLGAAG